MQQDVCYFPLRTNGAGSSRPKSDPPRSGQVESLDVAWRETRVLPQTWLSEAEAPQRPGGLRIAVYSHDAQGLGHVRRNLLLSRAIRSAIEDSSVLVISGLREAASFAVPDGVDALTLPSLGKSEDGRYFARSLALTVSDVVGIRRDSINAAIQAMRPDVFIIDKLPTGIFDELLPCLQWLKNQTRTRVVLGLRDILDNADATRREWERRGVNQAIRAYFDELWVYGDQAVFDVAQEYGLPDDIAEMIRYTGYLNPRHAPEDPQPANSDLLDGLNLPDGPLSLCLIGGGRDGLPLARAFLDASMPPGGCGLIVTGPLMDSEDLAALKAEVSRRHDIGLLEFVTDPLPLLCCADRVVSMGGYNTICEALAVHKPLLVVPRVRPRLEQFIRATRFAEQGLIDVLHPDHLTAESLSSWLASEPGAVPTVQSRLDFDGVRRIPGLLVELVSQQGVPGSMQ